MARTCPHCHAALTAIDGRLPPHCPQCGARTGKGAAAGGASLATYLRPATTSARIGSSRKAKAGTGDAPAHRLPDAAADAGVEAAALSHSGADAAPPPVVVDAAIDTDIAIATDTDAGPLHTAEAEAAPAAAPDSESLPLPASTAAAAIPPRARHAPAPSVATPRAPSFLQPSAAPPPRPAVPLWQWGALPVLALLLALQILLADRARLAADAGWRPWLGRLCATLGCSLPPWRQPEAFTMLGRDVRPLPGTPGALLMQASFRNDARWAQPWPVLRLSLSDADGRVVGSRALRPSDYLQPGAEAEIAAGQSAQVSVRLREPAAPVVAFSFEFR